ncbi:hypothetical protein [Bombilactobacillus thymidiniphilus]|uniref:Uncharacterized protein n=1 Tax=Bombilactobacillus thymidiniphilus TaxID=2923363 RepID=A0ABY4PES9_9LACO|nr:hypothetical protein [Bombilactobacillus thymidiniphilus]UQS84173.1 hypothetical protein MOO47_03210 [Bombilactobacillus thymidiniphilus]
MEEKDPETKREVNQRLLLQNEEQADDLKQTQHKLAMALADLQRYLQQNFRKISQINVENINRGDQASLGAQEANVQQERQFQRYFQDTHEQIAEDCHTKLRNLDDERDELYRQRGKI